MEKLANHLLYGTNSDYFSAKLRSFLDYQSIDFDEVVPSPQDIDAVIKARTGHDDWPVLVTSNNNVYYQSVGTIDLFEQESLDQERIASVIPTSAVSCFVTKLIELYCDSFMYLPALYMRWGYEESIVNAYSRLKRTYQSTKQAQFQANKERQKLTLFGLNNHNGPFFEYHAEQMVQILNDHFEHHAYVLGNRLSIADLALMGPLYAHFYQDIRPRELLLNNAPHLLAWIERMNSDDLSEQGEKREEWSSLRTLPETLYPLIQLISDDALLFWEENLSAWHAWADNDRVKTEPIPRFVSTHRFIWSAVSVEQPTSVSQVWQLQKLIAVYQQADEEDRGSIENMAESLGFSDLLLMEIVRPVGYKNYHFYHADAV